jgi:tetratricopeptide (TPR) repeat protein
MLALLIFFLMSSSGWSAEADDPNEMLARAEALYYQADFSKSIELLLRADELIQQQPGNVPEKIDVKLQLALGFIGLNDTARAKDYLRQLYALNPDHRIDPQIFSPKVIQLAEDARSEQNELRCQSAKDEAQRQLGTGNADAVVKLIQSNEGKCSGLTPLKSKTADVLFKQGLEAYKKTEMDLALQKFRAALSAEPKHELATEYLDLTESKLEIAADRALLAWRKDFNEGQFALAARDYRELVSRGSSESIDQVRGEYRRAVSSLVDSWNRACPNNDEKAMEEVRLRVNEMVPESLFVEDILAKMKTCTRTGCLQMTSQLALTRLKMRVDPEFPAYALSQLKVSPVVVHVKARINEKGDIATTEAYGGSPLLHTAVRTAVQQWKFSPALVDDQARCVDTDIPIIININK